MTKNPDNYFSILEFRKGQYLDLYYSHYLLQTQKITNQIIAYIFNMHSIPPFINIAR